MKRKLYLAFFALLLTMCRTYSQAEPLTSIDGLVCRPFNEPFGGTRGFECTYICPDGQTIGPRDFDIDPSFSATKGDLDRLLCGIAAPTFTQAATRVADSPTVPETPTVEASATTALTATPTIPPTGLPLFTGQVTMCDIGGNLISFRIVEAPPDLTGKTVTVEIAGQENSCEINPTNPSLMTCNLPNELTFPATVIVRLDDVVVNELTLNGIGCEQITTPVATTTP